MKPIQRTQWSTERVKVDVAVDLQRCWVECVLCFCRCGLCVFSPSTYLRSMLCSNLKCCFSRCLAVHSSFQSTCLSITEIKSSFAICTLCFSFWRKIWLRFFYNVNPRNVVCFAFIANAHRERERENVVLFVMCTETKRVSVGVVHSTCSDHRVTKKHTELSILKRFCVDILENGEHLIASSLTYCK